MQNVLQLQTAEDDLSQKLYMYMEAQTFQIVKKSWYKKIKWI